MWSAIDWGALLLSGALVGLTMYVHRRRLAWVALVMALISGVLLAASSLGGWIGELAGRVPYLPFLIVVVAAVVIGLDLRDKRPDRPAIVLAIVAPMFVAAALVQTPMVVDKIGASFQNVGDNASAGR